jgi:hypothetical protein
MNISIINKIIILGIIIILINHLGSNIFVNLYNYIKSLINIENFIGLAYNKVTGVNYNTPNIPYATQQDFPWITGGSVRNLDELSYDLYTFLNTLIPLNFKNYEMGVPNSKPLLMNKQQNEFVKTNIISRLNSNTFKFSNEKFPNELYYQTTNRGMSVVPFQLTVNVKDDRNNADLGIATLYIEAYLRNDNIKSTWILEMTNIKLTNLNGNLFTADKQLGKSIYKYEQFTNNNFNELFIKDDGIKIQYDDDDLIPDKIDMSFTDNSSVGSTESSYYN